MKFPLILIHFSLAVSFGLDLCDKCKCSVQILDCRHIPLVEIQDGTSLSPSIHTVFLSDTRLEYFHRAVFNVSNSEAQELDLSSNNLKKIEGQSFKSFRNLKKLLLKNNKITSLRNNSFKSLLHLTHLDLSYNDLPHLPQDMLVHLKNLTHLSLKYNFIKEIPVGFFRESQTLVSLDLSYLMLSDIDEEIFNWNLTLQKLDISHNFLSFIPSGVFEKLGDSLKQLDLSGNLFTTIPKLAFIGSKRLQILILEQLLHLSIIEAYAFSSLGSLETIQLKYLPMLHHIDEKAFHMLDEDENKTMVRYVPVLDFTLSFTTLSSMRSQLLNWTNLRQIELLHNRWSCNCNLAWMKNSTVETLTGKSIVCSSPPKLDGASILSLQREDFVCTTEPKNTTSSVFGIVAALCFLAFLIGLATVAALFYKENGWIIRSPHHFQRLLSDASSVTVYDHS